MSWVRGDNSRLRREPFVEEPSTPAPRDSQEAYSDSFARLFGETADSPMEDTQNPRHNDRQGHDERNAHGAQYAPNDAPFGARAADPAAPRSMRSFLQPPRTAQNSCIAAQPDGQRFEVKHTMLTVIPQFHGMDSESPYQHLQDFAMVCTTFVTRNVNENTVKLKLFPFSLKDSAKEWFNSLRANSIRTWPEMEELFLEKFFPVNRTLQYQDLLNRFEQVPKENFYVTWERFKHLVARCPHHGNEPWRLLQQFYKGLTMDTKKFVNTMCPVDFLG